MNNKTNTLSGNWVAPTPIGPFSLKFLSNNKLLINGRLVTYTIRPGLIRMTDHGFIMECQYVLKGGTLIWVFPNGNQLFFQRIPSTVTGKLSAGLTKRTTGKVTRKDTIKCGRARESLLFGTFCNYSNSSGLVNSSSVTSRFTFDGKGRFQFSSEASFTAKPLNDYSSYPFFSAYAENTGNQMKGNYQVIGDIIKMTYDFGNRLSGKVHLQLEDGTITEIKLGGKIYFRE